MDEPRDYRSDPWNVGRTQMDDDQLFELWMDDVDLAVEALCGLSTLDLADKPYRDWYDSGMNADEAADEVLEEEGFPF